MNTMIFRLNLRIEFFCLWVNIHMRNTFDIFLFLYIIILYFILIEIYVMKRKWWTFLWWSSFVFFLSVSCLIFSCVYAMEKSLSWTVPTTGYITIADPSSGTIMIDTTTGRYIRPEIQPQQNTKPNIIPENNITIYIPNTVILPLLKNAYSYGKAEERIRLLIIKTMLSKWFSGFISTPLADGNNKIGLLLTTGFVDFVLLEDIFQKDGLDNLIINKLIQYKNKISHSIPTNGLTITQQEYNHLHDIYLFKNNEDLYNLWYEVVSYRYRNNHDAAYRRYNISLAFSMLGNIRIINPHETFSFQNTIINADQANLWWNFKVWFAIVGWINVPIYWGGLCGASTAFYQWILTNTALKVTERYPHTKRYASFYNSVINGQFINTPGLDSTVTFPTRDIQVTNIRDYPLIVVMNYNGNIWWLEEAFSLAKISDKWTLQYKWSNKKCYVRAINGTDVSSCYQHIY